MSERVDSAINDYLTRFLLRYFRSAVAVDVSRPDLIADQDIDLLRLHWAVSEPVRTLVAHLRENPHQIQAVLESRVREDDARVRGRFDARATQVRRMLRGHPTMIVCQEPLRTYNSGPNHVLIWVLEQARRLVLRFHDLLPISATYLELVDRCASGLETIGRFDAVHQAAKQLNLTRRPSSQAIKEASRSRRPIYNLAGDAYRALQEIEAGEEAAILRLLNDTLLGPLHVWQRFELAVGLALGRALSIAQARPLALGFLAGGGEAIATAGEYEVYWQSRTTAYREPEQEPSEMIVSRLLRQYGIQEGSDRPDLIVFDRRTRQAMSVVEVKYFSHEEVDDVQALRAAMAQLVRYTRGYRALENLDTILDHSIVALVRTQTATDREPKPYGLPWLIDFEGIKNLKLESWAQRLVFGKLFAAAS